MRKPSVVAGALFSAIVLLTTTPELNEALSPPPARVASLLEMVEREIRKDEFAEIFSPPPLRATFLDTVLLCK